MSEPNSKLYDADPSETAEWREALDDVLSYDGVDRAAYLVRSVVEHAQEHAVPVETVSTAYINTIPPHEEPVYPGNLALEQRIQNILRWNAAAIVTQANTNFAGVGGHISTYASAAVLYEVGFSHFFRGPNGAGSGDQIFVQGHASPGIYARAFLEGRLSTSQLEHFRRESQGGGLSSYPHPWLMPDFWQFPTVSMGLGPIGAIYQARFNRYLAARNLANSAESRVWAFLGDGECDEPEALGALSLAGREKLNNLTFVINCNLQRLDGPVRGNGKIIQELESVFRGAGWNVIKVVWGHEWDELLAQDTDGRLRKRMGEVLDGQYQRFSVSNADVIRNEFFGADPELKKRIEHLTDDDLKKLRRGGHDVQKVYAAYARAMQSDKPTVILAKTVKGWGLGNAFLAANTTHQMKKMDEEQLLQFRDMLQLPISDDDARNARFYHPGEHSEEVRYMLAQRKALDGFLPQRCAKPVTPLALPAASAFAEFAQGGKAGVEVSTTMGFVRLLRNLMRDKSIGKRVVPIIPDEGRTFGMDAFFKEFGIYACEGQKYKPVDAEMFLHYHEAADGQLLEEGITEAGSMASFFASSTSYATHGSITIPFYIFYSMFGFQRTCDQIWSVGDARGRGFLLGATAGRTTLNGEGLQHEDGHSHLFALAVPNCAAYDPAFAYETSVIVQHGLKRMLQDNEDVFYYITLYNENYLMPAQPTQVEDGIIRGGYLFAPATTGRIHSQIFASGPFVNIALEAQKLLAEHFDVAASVWSITSYQQLYRDARATERNNRLNPLEPAQLPYIERALREHHAQGPIVAVSDWVAELPTLLAPFVSSRFVAMGTNGFGRSDTREALRRHFEVDAGYIAYTTMYALLQEGQVSPVAVQKAMELFDITPDKIDPMLV